MTKKQLEFAINASKKYLLSIIHPTFGFSHLTFVDFKIIPVPNSKHFNLVAVDKDGEHLYLAEAREMTISEIWYYIKGWMLANTTYVLRPITNEIKIVAIKQYDK